MNETLSISLSRVFVNGTAIADVVLLQVFPTGDQRGSKGLGEEEGLRILRVADGDMSICCAREMDS